MSKSPPLVPTNAEAICNRDTVNSVGVIPHRLPFTTSNTMVRTFRHAIALDERRAKFKANMWNRPTHNEELLSITDQETAVKVQKAEQRKAKGSNNRRGHMHRYETQYSNIRHETNVEEVGDHTLSLITLLTPPCRRCGSLAATVVRLLFVQVDSFHYLTILLLEDVGGGSGENRLHRKRLDSQLTFARSFQCY